MLPQKKKDPQTGPTKIAEQMETQQVIPQQNKTLILQKIVVHAQSNKYLYNYWHKKGFKKFSTPEVVDGCIIGWLIIVLVYALITSTTTSSESINWYA